jgi:tetratricopeptide (TPR) repeat protein
LHEPETYDDAIAAYAKALELTPDQFEPRANLGEIYLRLEQYHNALVSFLTARKFSSNDPKLHYYLGEVYMRLGKRDQASSELQLLTELRDPLAEELAKLIKSDSTN